MKAKLLKVMSDKAHDVTIAGTVNVVNMCPPFSIYMTGLTNT